MLSLRAIRSFSHSAVASKGFARAQLLGTVGNPEFRETSKGDKFITYGLAVDKYNGPDAEPTTQWYNVAVWDPKQVSILEKFLSKGTRLLVDADISIKKSEDGRTFTTFNQRSFEFLQYKKFEQDDSL